VVLCYSPDRLARKFAYQALLIEEFTRAGTRVEFVRGPRGDALEDQLLVQFQGMFAEYEKAQSWSASGAARRTAPRAERSTCWAAPCSAAAISVRPRAVGAAYEIVEHEIFTRSRNLLLQVEKVFCWSLLSGLNCSQRCWSVGQTRPELRKRVTERNAVQRNSCPCCAHAGATVRPAPTASNHLRYWPGADRPRRTGASRRPTPPNHPARLRGSDSGRCRSCCTAGRCRRGTLVGGPLDHILTLPAE
jgi:hypothetical protein